MRAAKERVAKFKLSQPRKDGENEEEKKDSLIDADPMQYSNQLA